LQQTGAIVSVGGTTLAPGTRQLLTQSNSINSILTPGAAITSITWLSGIATVTTAAPHGLPNPSTLGVAIVGAVPAAYNGTFLATVTGASTFTYPLAANPGAETVPGTWISADVNELVTQNNTFWAQGSQVAPYVLELGDLAPVAAIAALATYIAANPGTIYAFLVPSEWDGLSQYLALIAQYTTPTSRLYFITTSTPGTYTDYVGADKSAFIFIPSPDAPPTEFGAAWPFRSLIGQNPSSTSKATPFCYNYGFGITPWPAAGFGTQTTEFEAAFVNYGGPASEAGLSNVILRDGTSLDGNDMLYWYSVDWVEINLDLNTSNYVVANSNNKNNPLYYDQNGINRIQRVALSTMQQGVTNGLVLNGNTIQTQLSQSDFITAFESGAYTGMTVVNAEPFLINAAENPTDFPAGIYRGLSIAYVPARGFKQIIYNLSVSNFIVNA
jgi:hypothetical protein